MGADITHGIDLRKTSIETDDSEIVEITPVHGGYYGASYATVQAAVDYAASIGVDPELWPIYYGVADSEIEITDIDARCMSLRQSLLALPPEAFAGNAFLKRVMEWLHSGERFLITE
ncbi:hypothetical protein [Tuwongella immobilis]|uniref:Uncharacterized protein n=1 Tax=Tuwongella immobilis TaxID=692036 RepID=A0A6C2YUX5_9BACT|nr:hypothetical protein [Tuwongella immobilis]VIP05201.1 unnamed protein product [Tuwongella immobilis]VTS07758.1 unnamed protein product [Tuwongella immobilis]